MKSIPDARWTSHPTNMTHHEAKTSLLLKFLAAAVASLHTLARWCSMPVAPQSSLMKRELMLCVSPASRLQPLLDAFLCASPCLTKCYEPWPVPIDEAQLDGKTLPSTAKGGRYMNSNPLSAVRGSLDQGACLYRDLWLAASFFTYEEPLHSVHH